MSKKIWAGNSMDRKSLRVTPAMGVGVSDHVWDLGDIAAVVERDKRQKLI